MICLIGDEKESLVSTDEEKSLLCVGARNSKEAEVVVSCTTAVEQASGSELTKSYGRGIRYLLCRISMAMESSGRSKERTW